MGTGKGRNNVMWGFYEGFQWGLTSALDLHLSKGEADCTGRARCRPDGVRDQPGSAFPHQKPDRQIFQAGYHRPTTEKELPPTHRIQQTVQARMTEGVRAWKIKDDLEIPGQQSGGQIVSSIGAISNRMGG